MFGSEGDQTTRGALLDMLLLGMTNETGAGIINRGRQHVVHVCTGGWRCGVVASALRTQPLHAFRCMGWANLRCQLLTAAAAT